MWHMGHWQYLQSSKIVLQSLRSMLHFLQLWLDINVHRTCTANRIVEYVSIWGSVLSIDKLCGRWKYLPCQKNNLYLILYCTNIYCALCNAMFILIHLNFTWVAKIYNISSQKWHDGISPKRNGARMAFLWLRLGRAVGGPDKRVYWLVPRRERKIKCEWKMTYRVLKIGSEAQRTLTNCAKEKCHKHLTLGPLPVPVTHS